MKCSFCGYEWKPKTISPKECPRCKRYLKIKTPTTIIKEIEGYKNV